MVALTQARGLSIVHETVYERRLGYTEALNQMGATIQTYRECLGGTPCRFGRRNFRHSAVIAGPSKLHAADLVIPDLRAGFSHLIAALAAEGTSRVYGVDLINRGYEDFEAKMAALGAQSRTRVTPDGTWSVTLARVPFPFRRKTPNLAAAAVRTSADGSATALDPQPKRSRPSKREQGKPTPKRRQPGRKPAAPPPTSRREAYRRMREQ